MILLHVSANILLCFFPLLQVLGVGVVVVVVCLQVATKQAFNVGL